MVNEAQACWVVDICNYESVENLGIFSTREKAIKFVNQFINSRGVTFYRGMKYENVNETTWKHGTSHIFITERTLDRNFLNENSNK